MRTQLLFLGTLIACTALGLSVGCETSPSRDAVGSGPVRNQQRAAEITNEAIALLAEDPFEAERLLREALQADLYYGPAHNNLGVLHLNRGELYLAAEEFDWARKLMPGHPDPRINLGLALERGGKIDEALDAYASAIEVYPQHLPAMEALVRCQIRHGYDDDQTEAMLKTIAFQGSPEWKSWARTQLDTED